MIYDEEMAKVSMSTSAVAIFPTNHKICTYSLTLFEWTEWNIFRSRNGTGTSSKSTGTTAIVFVQYSRAVQIHDRREAISTDRRNTDTSRATPIIHQWQATWFAVQFRYNSHGRHVQPKSASFQTDIHNTRDLHRYICENSNRHWFTHFSSFSSAKHAGCFLHFCQAVYRQIQQLGLQRNYGSDEPFRLLHRKLMALSSYRGTIHVYRTLLSSYRERRNEYHPQCSDDLHVRARKRTIEAPLHRVGSRHSRNDPMRILSMKLLCSPAYPLLSQEDSNETPLRSVVSFQFLVFASLRTLLSRQIFVTAEFEL